MPHKSPLETELKLRIPDPEDCRVRLRTLGFREHTPSQSERSVLWDRNGELQASGSALRTRSYAGHVRLTWKGPRVPHPLLKVRPELETAVADGPALEAILRALGFEPVMALEKLRSLWLGTDLEACLDETPFGCYLELEGDPEAIRRALEGLGISPDQAETRSYPDLYRAHGLGGIEAPR